MPQEGETRVALQALTSELPRKSQEYGVMTRLSDLIHRQDLRNLPPTTTVKRACEQMRAHRTTAVLVGQNDGHLLGIFTGRDALWRVLAAGRHPGQVTLGDVMTPHPTTISPSTTTIEALRLMWDGGFRHLPVTDKGKVVGLVMRQDFKSEDLSRLEEERELWEHMR
jgi:CBS domain-containing protein